MNNIITSRILLGEKRGKTEYKGLCSHHVFNFGNYKLGGRETFGEITAFNEDLLAPQNSTLITVEADGQFILIPLAGGIEILLNNSNENLYATAGKFINLYVKKSDTVKITNPYPQEVISFLQIWLNNDGSNFSDKEDYISAFNINIKNTLLPLFTSQSGGTKAWIGKYDLREKGIFNCAQPIPNLMAYVVTGAFEFQDRLIQQKDSLRFENVCTELDYQALSHEAILLVLQTTK